MKVWWSVRWAIFSSFKAWNFLFKLAESALESSLSSSMNVHQRIQLEYLINAQFFCDK